MPSILTGVVVVGILAAGVLAAIFGVIPYTQNNGAKQDLSSIRTAEGVAKAKDNRFMDHAGLLDTGYLQLPSTKKTKVMADEKGTCYVALAKSGTGKIFYSTDANTDPELFEADTDPGCLPADKLAELIDSIGGIEKAEGRPSNLKLTAISALQAKAVWDRDKGASGYKVEYQVDEGDWTLLSEDSASTTATMRALPEQTVRIRVAAIRSTGLSEPATAAVKLPDSTLKNPSFEDNLQYWTTSGGIKTTAGTVQTGALAASLPLYANLYQVVSVPDDRPVLTFASRSRTQGVTPKVNNTVVATASEDVGNGWYIHHGDISAYVGQTVTISFTGNSSPSGQLDDVDLAPASAPFAPISVAASSRLGTATATWSSPPFDGASRRTSFTATAWKDGDVAEQVTVPADTFSATFSTLTTGAEYTFTVAAKNNLGISEESAPYGPVVVIPGAIANPSFELGGSGWKLGGFAVSATATPFGSSALKVDDYSRTTTQVITVPADTPVLTYWSTYSGIKVKAGSVTLPQHTTGKTSGSWTQYKVDLSAYAGAPMTLGVTGALAGNQYADNFELNRATVADAPTSVLAMSKLGDAGVSWVGPAYNGGAPITHFRVDAWNGGHVRASLEAAPTAKSVTMTGLSAGEKYIFTVTAVNSVGESASPASREIGILKTPIANPGFEDGAAGWTFYKSGIAAGGHSGGSSLVLSGYDSEASQSLTVPADKPVLSFWSKGRASHLIGSSSKSAVATGNTDGVWAEYHLDLSSYAGKTILYSTRSSGGTYQLDDYEFVAK
ncbi:fibronectin type III domain-containing protein [Arthrobacter caoxuetaonis]|uniref:Fibronectin type III domain-containing protein n=1 Tax=Arthrobacter caoxuetaonis TaxID=2886935 RepID=A0A9X1SE14_9MICC|nr:fibronectin type III domain-containing protein [Arthrobacter caoxuetaonis]MCC3299713.1 fibronectin type III domain-containing protein [Arthrobacter caoxuetaonis]USQ59385.1 fibronectin type III domain-containing protein [Arthrobacter caoxuetaonis]